MSQRRTRRNRRSVSRKGRRSNSRRSNIKKTLNKSVSGIFNFVNKSVNLAVKSIR
jgi:hypothetical protein